jgi:DNA-binding transcriptional MerR regulator
MLNIGDFARLGDVSVRTLRFYAQMGLLPASEVDPNTGYRHYEVGQLALLRRIRSLQDLGFRLSEIRRLTRRDLPPAELRALMQERRLAIKRQIREDFARLARIDQGLRDLTCAGQDSPAIVLRATTEAWVVSLREKIQRYDQAEEMFQELERRVPTRLLNAHRAAFWHSCASGGGSIDCEVVRYLKQPITPARGMRSYRLPGTTVASAFHCGSDETIGESYKHLNRWITSRDFRLRGPKREIYWFEPHGQNAKQAITEIQFPVARMRAKPLMRPRAA